MYLILSRTKFAIFRSLDLEDQIIFTQCDFDILVYTEEDLGELVSARRILIVVIDLCFFSRRILKYNLFSFVEYNEELLIAKFGISLA